MKNVAVLLAGCGVFDGSEIHEAVVTLLALARAGVGVQCFAPDMPQHHVVNHLSGQVMESEQRNVLVESARLARGNVKDCSKASADAYDALIIPGGYGAAKNLSDFASKGSQTAVHPAVQAFVRQFAAQKKPVGFFCISPAMIPKIYGEGVRLTIGSDAGTAHAIEAMGGVHVNCPVRECVVDEAHNIVSTPAYMLAGNIAEMADGVEKAVKQVLARIA